MTMSSKICAAALLAFAAPSFVGTAAAAPLGQSLALSGATPARVETVQYRWRGGWRGGWRGPWWPGVAAGAVIGGAIAASRPWYGYDYGYYDYGYGPGPYAYSPVPGDAVAYCQRRFRSYDPASGTYLGYDGLRHPCP